MVDSPGDNLLAEFPSAVDAVKSAVAIQQELKTRNAELEAHRRMEFRIGLNVGDVIADEGRLYGDGVNIAARLEGLADPGGICISGNVHEQVRNKLALGYEYVGEREVKNIASPVAVWRIQLEESSSPQVSGPSATGEEPPLRRAGVARRTWLVGAVTGVALIVGAIIAGRYFPLPIPSTQSPTPSPQPPPSTQSSALGTEKAKPPLPLPDKLSIVVLPFDNMSKDPEQEYFSNGITEVLTSDLSRISSLFVIARNTAFTYKGKATNVQAIGKELGVRYALEGSVQKANEQVRIVVQLIDATTGGHLWSERFDRPFKDIFALQDEIVQKIVTTLKLQLTMQEQGYSTHKHTDNLEAYDFFLRGLDFFSRTTKEANTQARQMFEKAVALDPQYAEAYAWLGFNYWVEWFWRWSADSQALERALALAAQQALALDDSLPGAYTLLSLVYAQQQQYDQAIVEGERALALNPNNDFSYDRQGVVLTFAGRPGEALPLIEQAMRLNPRYPPYYLGDLGWSYIMTGQYTEAVATLKEATRRGPNLMVVYPLLANSYVQQWASQQEADAHTLEHALMAVQRTVALNDSYPGGRWTLGSVYLWQKQYEPAVTEMERAVALAPNEALSYALLGEALSRVGRSEEAVRMIEQALRRKPFVADVHLLPIGVAYSLAGKPEEAIAPLKQYLTRYPNILPAHLTLAAVYSELGKDAEAQAEAAEVLRINPKFSLEVHKERVPIKGPATLERHIAALRKAGLR